MTTFLQELARDTNLTTTENGAATYASSLSASLDYFAAAGAMRDTPDKAADLFEKAYREDPQTAVRIMFYLRDVRGGQGERAMFRACLKRLADLGYSDMGKVLKHVPEYGRWDDVFYDGSTVTGPMVQLVGEQLVADAKACGLGQPVSLAAKWLPSEKSKSRQRLWLNLRRALGLSERKYRKVLSRLRSHIGLLEHQMSDNRWEDIDYGKLPSRAHMTHVKAFKRHTPDKYQAYLDSVNRGEADMKASVLYPYELYDMAYGPNADAASAFWENLPDYTRGNDGIVLADVSGSMTGRPMAVSVSLALYFAERNQGAYKGYFMTFSDRPQLVKVEGDTLADRLANIESSDWGMSTDLEAAFDAILAAAKRSGAGEVPKTLYIVSDMEFNQATGSWDRRSGTFRQSADDTMFETAKRKFADAGLVLPHVVFWNVNARNSNYPATMFDGNVTLVSGLSPSVFGMAVEGKAPAELMSEVVNGPRYQPIVI